MARMAETFSSRVRLRITLALLLMKSKLYVEGARVVGTRDLSSMRGYCGVDRGAPPRISEQGSSLVACGMSIVENSRVT
jgi:hypothetical protein